MNRADLVLWCWTNQFILRSDRITDELLNRLTELVRRGGGTVIDPPVPAERDEP